MSTICPYKCLGLSRGASSRRIDKAYDKLIILHPDKKGSAESNKFAEITMSYRILKDPDTRSCFDKLGAKASPRDFEKAWKAANQIYSDKVKADLDKARRFDDDSEDRKAAEKARVEKLNQVQSVIEDINQAAADIQSAQDAINASTATKGALPKLCETLPIAEEAEALLQTINVTQEEFESSAFSVTPQGKQLKKIASLLAKCWTKLDIIHLPEIKQKFKLVRERLGNAQLQVAEAKKNLEALEEEDKPPAAQRKLDELMVQKGEILVAVANMKPFHDQIIGLKRYIVAKVRRCEGRLLNVAQFHPTPNEVLLAKVQLAFTAADKHAFLLKDMIRLQKEQIKLLEEQRDIAQYRFSKAVLDSEVKTVVEDLVTRVAIEADGNGKLFDLEEMDEKAEPQENYPLSENIHNEEKMGVQNQQDPLDLDTDEQDEGNLMHTEITVVDAEILQAVQLEMGEAISTGNGDEEDFGEGYMHSEMDVVSEEMLNEVQLEMGGSTSTEFGDEGNSGGEAMHGGVDVVAGSTLLNVKKELEGALRSDCGDNGGDIQPKMGNAIDNMSPNEQEELGGMRSGKIVGGELQGGDSQSDVEMGAAGTSNVGGWEANDGDSGIGIVSTDPTVKSQVGQDDKSVPMDLTLNGQLGFGDAAHAEMGICKFFGPQLAIRIEYADGNMLTVTPFNAGSERGMSVWKLYQSTSPAVAVPIPGKAVAAVHLVQLRGLPFEGMKKGYGMPNRIEFRDGGVTTLTPVCGGGTSGVESLATIGTVVQRPRLIGTQLAEARKYFCGICGIGFAHQSSLSRHRDGKHPSSIDDAEKKYKCDVCGKRFNRNDCRIRHLVQVHFPK